MPPRASSCRIQLASRARTLVRAKLAALEPSPDLAVPFLNAAAGAVGISSGQKPPEEHSCAWHRCRSLPWDRLLRGGPGSGRQGWKGPSHRALPFIGLPAPLCPAGVGGGTNRAASLGPSWTRNKPPASALRLYLRSWGQGGPQELTGERWVSGEQIPMLAEPSHAARRPCRLREPGLSSLAPTFPSAAGSWSSPGSLGSRRPVPLLTPGPCPSSGSPCAAGQALPRPLVLLCPFPRASSRSRAWDHVSPAVSLLSTRWGGLVASPAASFLPSCHTHAGAQDRLDLCSCPSSRGDMSWRNWVDPRQPQSPPFHGDGCSEPA